MARRIRKNDTVLVLRGRDRGKRGRVLRVVEHGEKVIVEGVNMIAKHLRAGISRQHPQGGIIRKEAPLHVSKVALVDPNTDEPCRVGFRYRRQGEDFVKVRINRKTGATIDVVARYDRLPPGAILDEVEA